MSEQDKTTVLLIEDNPGDARLFEEMLQMKGNILDDSDNLSPNLSLVHEERLEDGLERLESEPVDIVLLDLMLPDSSGEATFDAVLDRTREVPIVLLTGLNDREFGVNAVQRGAQDYLIKGEIDGELLVRTMRYAIERKKNERELARRTEQLAIMNQILEHDIRNDMNVISGMAELLRERVDDPDHEEYLDRMLENSDHVVELTETASTLLETVAGEEDPDLEPVDAARVLESEVRKARTSHDGATFVAPDDLPEIRVRANSMLSSVFGNLLNNAVQHNDAEEPRVEVDVATRDNADNDAGDGTAEIRIADNGPGVPADQRDAVFGRGEQGIDSSGTGIGLYLVDTLVGQYGGSVRIEDNDPRGATFVVELAEV
ncbi:MULTISPECIES: hybrid sensor histidine kinase/response regulator [Halorussus]|uniref:hybrid sensor histidine kinase/response regulator n=1 Tax=Halorussus TaxID=1070314 RepID=UPI000E213598|nr:MULTISPECIES: hybrid sensor histidine kinase/response regulator [Halorussus]NHN59966.1 response regulator [Halorussus sp. JP-T4]